MGATLNATTPARLRSRRVWAGRGVMSIADHAAQAAAGLMLNVVLARALRPQDYGIFTLLFVGFLFASGFHTALVVEPLLIFGSGRYVGRFRAYLRQVLALHGWFSVVAAAVMLAGSAVAWAMGAAAVASGLAALAVTTPLALLQWLVRRACYCHGQTHVAVLASGGYLVVLAGTLAGMQAAGGLSIATGVLAFGVAGFLSALPVAAWLAGGRDASPGRVTARGVWRRHWRYGRWVCFTAVTRWLSQDIFYFALPLVASAAAVGHLRAMVTLTLPLGQVFPPLLVLLTPVLVRQRATGAFDQTVRRVTAAFAAGGAAFWLLLWVVREPVVRALYGAAFVPSADLLGLLALMPIAICLGGVWRAGLRAHERSDLIFTGSLAAAAVTLTAGAALVLTSGVTGAAIGLVLAPLTSGTVNAWQLRRLRRQRSSAAADGAVRAAWLVPNIPQYRLPFIRRLAEERAIEVTCYHSPSEGQTAAEGALASLPLRHVAVPCIYWRGSLRMAWQRALWRILRGGYEVVVCVEAVHHLTVWALWLLRRWGGYRLVLFGYGFRSQPSGPLVARVRQALRWLLLRSADAVICYTDRGRDAVVAGGIDPARVFVTRNTLDTEMLLRVDAAVTPERLAALRRELALGDDPTVVFVGRLLEGKRVDVLIDACRLLREGGTPCRLLIVGDGPERAALEARAGEVAIASRAVVFAGAVYDEARLAEWMRLASLLVIPGRVGLTCVHGFAHGLPTVTTDESRVEQSPEYAYIEHGRNGWIVAEAEAGLYARTLAELLGDADRLASMRGEAYASAGRLTMSRMVAEFVRAIEYAAGRGAGDGRVEQAR